MPYDPTSFAQEFRSFEAEGWYKLRVDSAVVGTSSGGYRQIKTVFLVEEGEYEGNKVFFDIIIPPVEKGYRVKKDEKTGEPYFDRNSQTYWLLKTGWTLQVFGIHLDQGDEMKNLKAIQKEANLQKIADKMIGQSAVGYIVPGTYQKKVTNSETGEEKEVTRTKGELKELRYRDYEPKEGFVLECPTPPVGIGKTAAAVPDMDDVELDPDIDLQEDEDFFVDKPTDAEATA